MTGETESGHFDHADMLVCVGYFTTTIRFDQGTLRIGQVHADPDAAACSLSP